jgi:integration host factor subunit beta
MLKTDLVFRIAGKNPHLRVADVEKIVGTILGEITSAMARGDRIEIRGFGSFSVRLHEAHTGRNPQTGAKVLVKEKLVPFFRAAKEIKGRLNSKA